MGRVTGTETVETEEHTFKMGLTGVEYTANAIPNTNTEYKVQYWQQNITGDAGIHDEINYTLMEQDTENKTGTTDTQTDTTPKEYIGFKTPEIINENISGDGTTIVNYYYERRDDLSCTIKYIEKDTGKLLEERKLENQIFGNELESRNQVIEIEEYDYEGVQSEILKIGTGENIINIYYLKKKGNVVVHHYLYDEGYTIIKIVPDEEIIKKLGESYTTSKSIKIPANFKVINEQPEGCTGTITKDTKETCYYYKLIEPKTEGNISSEIVSGGKQDENGNWTIEDGEEIKYVIKYEVKIDDYIGDAEIKIVAKLPAGIDVEKSDLKGGIYDKENNAIIWTEKIENLDTFTNGIYEDTIIKEITLVYNEDINGKLELEVGGKITTYYPENYPGKENESFTEQTAREEGKVIVHHYLYEEDYTTIKIVPDEEITSKIGENYTTSKSSKISGNYKVINEKPEGYAGIIARETKEISYYYSLIEPKTEGNISSEIVSGGKQDENGNWTIEDGEEIKYVIKYEVKIDDYIGEAEIKIVAKLPAGIDVEKSDLKGGIYDKENNAIIWTEKIENLDAFTNGAYEDTIIKEITLVYNEDINGKLELEVGGKITTYYPENYPGKENESFTEQIVYEEGKVIVHHYLYDEGYTTIKIVEDEEIIDKLGSNYTTSKSDKKPLNYTCINEKTEGYIGIITREIKEINYYYKLIEPKTEGNISSEIISGGKQDENGNWTIEDGEKIKYVVEYDIRIEDYIGDAEVKIIVQLPAGIDIEKSDLSGGIYDEKNHTITWTEKIENLDTFTNGTYEDTITKEITLVYNEDINGKLELEVGGKITTYYPEDYPGKGGQSFTQEITLDKNANNQGKIIIKYIDIDTNQEIINITKSEEGTYGYEISDTIGKAYETEEKEIPYYILVRVEGRTKGEIKEETEEVTYYYRKQNFNIGIDKTIETINVNGENVKISNNKVAKLELKKDDINKAEIIVKYQIKVTNTGELVGTSRILELIPEGYELAYLPEYWKVNRDGSLETNVGLEAGQSRELEVVLKWKNEENNLGVKTNIAKIEETRNQANFRDTNEEDNLGEATIVISIKTGEVVSIIVIMMIITALGISGYITLYATRRKEPGIKDIKFLK